MSSEFTELKLLVEKDLIFDVKSVINKTYKGQPSTVSVVIDGKVWISGHAYVSGVEATGCQSIWQNTTSLSMNCFEQKYSTDFPNPYDRVPFSGKEVGYE